MQVNSLDSMPVKMECDKIRA